MTVAREATGHRWRVLEKQASERGLNLVCVQSLLVWRTCEQDDLTWDKSDPLVVSRAGAGSATARAWLRTVIGCGSGRWWARQRQRDPAVHVAIDRSRGRLG